jgi:hypothetical protein
VDQIATSGRQAAEVLRLRSAALEWRPVDGEIVALDLDRMEYLDVNRTGAGLWLLLRDGTTRPAMARYLVETYGVDQERADSDVDDFVTDLAAQRLLET